MPVKLLFIGDIIGKPDVRPFPGSCTAWLTVT